MPSPSVSVSVTGVSATASAGTAVAGSSTPAGSAAGPESGAGAGTTSTGASTESTADGAIRVVPDPGAISPHVIVQSPTPAPEVTQLLSILPRMNGPSVFWAEATPLTAMSPTLRPTSMLTRFIATSLAAGIMASRGVDAGRHRQRLKATALLQRVGPRSGFLRLGPTDLTMAPRLRHGVLPRQAWVPARAATAPPATRQAPRRAAADRARAPHRRCALADPDGRRRSRRGFRR